MISASAQAHNNVRAVVNRAGIVVEETVFEAFAAAYAVLAFNSDNIEKTVDELTAKGVVFARFTNGRALDLARRGKRGGLASALSHGLWAFVRSYGLKRGFLDGRLGLVLAIYIAHSTYYRYLKMGLAASGTAK